MYRSLILFVGVCIAIQLVLFRVKYDVVQLEREYKLYVQQINKKQEDLHVLEAEWAHLNQPHRIERLTQKYLTSLKPLTGKAMLSLTHMTTLPPLETKHEFIQKTNKVEATKPQKTSPVSVDELLNGMLDEGAPE
jgi:hypothetical protein